MTVTELTDRLRAETTGDLQADLKHLEEVAESLRQEENAAELAEAVAKYAFSLMPEEQRAEMEEQTMIGGRRLDRVYQEAMQLVREKKYAEAEPLLAALSEKIAAYFEDGEIRYYSFRNPFEYHLYLEMYPDEDRNTMRAPFDFGAYLAMYGYVLVELRRTQEAEDVLRRAVRMNPVAADMRYELAELYKLTGRMDMLLETCRDTLQICTSADRIAHVLANLGYYCCEIADYYASAVFYFDSMRFLPNDMTEAALKDVLRRMKTFGMKFAPPTKGQTLDTYEKYGMQPPPNSMLINLAAALAQSARKHDRPELEGLFTRVAFDLTNDPQFRERLSELDAILAERKQG